MNPNQLNESAPTDDFTPDQTANLERMVQQSVKAHGLLKSGKSVKTVASMCGLPTTLVRDMANEVRKPGDAAARTNQLSSRKNKRKAQSKARKLNRK